MPASVAFTTHQAALEELPLILQILKEGAEALQSKGIDQWQGWHAPDAERLAWVQDGLTNGEFYFLEAEGQTIGMYRYLHDDELYWGPQTISARYVHSLAVRAPWAGLGVGRQLMERLFVQAKAEGAAVFRLDCVATNTHLQRYYQSLGFVPVGETALRGQRFTLFERVLYSNLIEAH
jgi:GNAT superfamily N-acetyltransferase